MRNGVMSVPPLPGGTAPAPPSCGVKNRAETLEKTKRAENPWSTRIGLPSYPQLPKSLYDLQSCLPVGQLRPCHLSRRFESYSQVQENCMQGKVVLVTGANGGLGRYVAQSFLDAGATVVGNSRKIQQSDFSGANFVALPGGISTCEEARLLVDQAVAR